VNISEIEIQSLASGGAGVGRIDGKACFVPYSAPGDILKVRIEKEHRSWTEATIYEITTASPLRQEPFCRHFGICGGCGWQHIRYDAQCDAKARILADSLSRIGSIADPPVAPVVASPVDRGYRARAQFKLFAAPDRLHAGFFRRGSRCVVDLPDGCPLVTPAVNMAFLRLRELLSSLPDANRLPQITIDEGEDGAYAILHYIGESSGNLVRLLKQNEKDLGLAGLFLQSGRKESITRIFGESRVTYTVPSKDGEMILGYGIGSFSQVNRHQNREMIRIAINLAGEVLIGALLDLYCGNGNLCLPLAYTAGSVTGIEGYEPSIASAVDNSRQASVNNSTFICADAVAGLDDLLMAGRRFDLVLLDPPRTGAFDLVRKIAETGAEKIIYVSCDPATLARDLAFLAGKRLYRLETAIPLDMFPQTSHLETVSMLKKI